MNRPWGHECAIDSQPTVFSQLSGPAGSLPAPRENTRFAAFAARFRPSKRRNAPFACSVVPSPTKTSDPSPTCPRFFRGPFGRSVCLPAGLRLGWLYSDDQPLLLTMAWTFSTAPGSTAPGSVEGVIV